MRAQAAKAKLPLGEGSGHQYSFMLRYRLFMNNTFLKEVKEGKGRKPEERAEKNDREALIFFPTQEG